MIMGGDLNQPCVVLRALPSLRTHSHAAFTRLRQNKITTSSIITITSIIWQYDHLPDHNCLKINCVLITLRMIISSSDDNDDHLADDNLIISADRTGGLFPKLGRVWTLGWHRTQSVVSLCNCDRDDDSLIKSRVYGVGMENSKNGRSKYPKLVIIHCDPPHLSIYRGRDDDDDDDKTHCATLNSCIPHIFGK